MLFENSNKFALALEDLLDDFGGAERPFFFF